MPFQRLRPWLRRATIGGGTIALGAAAFPILEDFYWHRRDPCRVWDNGSGGTTAENQNDAGTASSSTPSPSKTNEVKKKNLVIVGTGWASVSVLKHINRDLYNVTVVSPRNYFLFTPLLPSVSSGTVTTEAITIPIRELTTYQALRLRFLWRGHLPDRVQYFYAAASDVDFAKKTVQCHYPNAGESFSRPTTFDVPYDVLVIGAGASTNTFNTEGVNEHSHYLKETGDATLIRQAVLTNLENASLPNIDEQERKRLLSFWVVGGGPTAVEAAAELQDFLFNDVVNPKHATFSRCAGATTVTLVQSNKDLLPGYPKPIRDFTLDHMRKSGIKVLTGARATKVTHNTISVYDKQSKSTQEIAQGLVIWATGVAPGPFVQKLMTKMPEQSSYRTLKTDWRCRVIGGDSVYAIGDCADIDMLASHHNEIRLLYDKCNEEFPQAKNGRGLSPKASALFLDMITEKLSTVVSAPGAKIVAELQSMIIQSKDSSSGLTADIIESVVGEQMKRQKHLPPTAQVAHQQGEYLARLLNDPLVDESTDSWSFDHKASFEFTNLGQLVYVGGHMAAISVPGKNDMNTSWNGQLTNFVWHAAYFGMLESVSARAELLFQWIKTHTFGRSTALDAICFTDSSRPAGALQGNGSTLQRSGVPEEKSMKSSWWSVLRGR